MAARSLGPVGGDEERGSTPCSYASRSLLGPGSGDKPGNTTEVKWGEQARRGFTLSKGFEVALPFLNAVFKARRNWFF